MYYKGASACLSLTLSGQSVGLYYYISIVIPKGECFHLAYEIKKNWWTSFKKLEVLGGKAILFLLILL